MNYLLDTNILLLKLRGNQQWHEIYEQYQLGTANNIFSIVSVGELHSLALRNDWDDARIAQIDLLRKEFGEIDIYYEEIIHKYAMIDAFSQGN
jgi:predicted nucleic acid-binding protein